ncbi:MAG TPA: hypothetical protein PK289_04770 [Bacteroidia bacterium]|jgi:hypothetical protein|nr:hypothetical protein [Bacteroidia bacterium]
MNTIVYPQYRKYKNNKVYFKIISANEWEELHVLGNKVRLHPFVAKILPDRNYISDMTFDYKDHWELIEEEEYEELKKRVG